MTITLAELSGGLSEDRELFFPAKPENPEMRESTSIWLFEDHGTFGCPRMGIEGEAWSWENRLYQAHFGFAGGRIIDATGRGPAPSPFGPEGKPTVFGAGPLTFRCVEAFRKWIVTFDGVAADGTSGQQIARTFDRNKLVPVKFETELTMATPGWVQDNSPEKVAKMSETDAADAASMGIGWRIEHLFRARGTLSVDGERKEFKATGSRIKRQSVRPLGGFRGHVWQSALFPDGRAFGYITYPPAPDGKTYNDGYIYQDGRMHRAHAVKIPWLRRFVAEGDDVSFELQSDLGLTRIEGSSLFSTFDVHNPEMASGRFNLQQSGARYRWDGQTSYGMLERSSTDMVMQ
jgi:hypothetical protein